MLLEWISSDEVLPYVVIGALVVGYLIMTAIYFWKNPSGLEPVVPDTEFSRWRKIMKLETEASRRLHQRKPAFSRYPPIDRGRLQTLLRSLQQ